MWAVVPLKQLEQAKARLASVLSADERRALMLAMARDVLTALGGSKRLKGILIVSRTPEADALAQAFATERFAEGPGANLSQALVLLAAELHPLRLRRFQLQAARGRCFSQGHHSHDHAVRRIRSGHRHARRPAHVAGA